MRWAAGGFAFGSVLALYPINLSRRGLVHRHAYGLRGLVLLFFGYF